MIKAVIFDMDGVISDTEPFHKISGKKNFKRIGISVTNKYLETFAGTRFQEYTRRIVKEKTGKELTDDDIQEMFKQKWEIMMELIKDVKPISGVVDIIKFLHNKGFKLAVASSSLKKYVHFILKKLRINEYFDIVVCGDEIKKSKPDPDIFLVAAKKLGMKQEECIVIEDTRNGVLAAKAAGMKCIGFISKHSGHQDLSLADVKVSSMKNITMELIRG